MQKRTRSHTFLLLVIILFGVILSGCNQQEEPAIDIEAQKTGFAQTANVQATQTADAIPTATETLVPTATLTPMPEPTETQAVTPTETESTATSQVGGGTDQAVLLWQEPADNTAVKPGSAFTVQWTFENRGTSTWSTGYYIQYASGEQMGADEKVFMWLPVPPGTSLTLTVNLVAPQSLGTAQSNWKLFNASDNAFFDFSITIEVSETGTGATPTLTPEATIEPTPTATEEPES